MTNDLRRVRVDLHCHSSFSDGQLSPEQLAEKLAASGVQAASLTDHETLRGLARFQSALEKYGIQSIPGAEIEVQSLDGAIHLLAYGFDTQDREFQKYLTSLRYPLWAETLAWVQRVRGTAGGDGRQPANNGHFHAPRAIEQIHRAGGVAFLAHPITNIPSLDRLEKALDHLVSDGLDGIEAYYKPYPQAQQEALAAMAERRCLLTSAGSDYHGEHFSAGAAPGIEMPEPDWQRFLDAVVNRQAVPPSS